jgi:tRNA dimethylallyltransferase
MNKALSAALPGPVVAVVGPTGVGKTAVGEALALRLGSEVVSADSMQVYRGMDIGTAKQPVALRSVPYHCIDITDPDRPFSAALFQRAARPAIDALLASGRVPVVVGGTELGADGLHAYLAARDPAAAALIHRNNTRRVLRAIEMLETSGVSYADQHALLAERRAAYQTVWIGLTMNRGDLYERIGERVDGMLAAGLLAEVEGLLAAGYRRALTAAHAIGYKELVSVLEEGADLEEAVLHIKQASRRYAKRQLTWFCADPRVNWLDVTGLSPDETVEAAYALVSSGSAT